MLVCRLCVTLDVCTTGSGGRRGTYVPRFLLLEVPCVVYSFHVFDRWYGCGVVYTFHGFVPDGGCGVVYSFHIFVSDSGWLVG